jgi:hypothetical protein
VPKAVAAAIIQAMRRAAVYLSVIALLAVSLGIAWVAADWPHWCRLLHWCDGRGLL